MIPAQPASSDPLNGSEVAEAAIPYVVIIARQRAAARR